MERFDTIVIGSGACGLTVARRLHDAGQRVVVLDKGKRPGGRMASRPIGDTMVNTGVHEVVCTSDEAVDEIVGRVGETVNVGATDDGRRVLRFTRSAGDTARVWARPLDVRTTLVTHLEHVDDGFAVVAGATGQPLVAPSVVLTAPFPQSDHLLTVSGLPGLNTHGPAATYERRMVLLVRTETSEPSVTSDVLSPRQVSGNDDGTTAMVLLVDRAWSDAAWDDDVSIVHARLLLEARRVMPECRVVWSDVKQWRYANATATVSSPFVRFDRADRADRADDIGTVLVGGDAFGDVSLSGVERAVLSGLRIVEHLV